MLRQAARRHGVGCYKILSSNYHHVTKGRSVLHAVRPSVPSQQIWRHPECMKAARLLPGLYSKSFSSTEVEDTVDIPKVINETKGSAQLKNVLKMCAIECFEDENRRKLFVKLKADLHANDILGMSDDIVDIYIKPSQFAYLKFNSEEDAMKNMKILSERDEFAEVNSVGEKRFLEIAERNAKRLKLDLAETTMTEADVKSMAEGIREVDIKMGNFYQQNAYLTFDSEEDAIRAYKQLKQDSRVSKISFLGKKQIQKIAGKMNLYLPVDEGVKKEDLFKLSDDIIDVRFVEGGKAVFLDFGSEEIAEKNYRHFVSTLGKDVRFTRNKHYDSNDRTLMINVENTITEQDILPLSADILNVRFSKSPKPTRFAFLEFTSTENMLKNLPILREKFGWFEVHRKTNGLYERDSYSLMLHNIEPSVTKEKVLNLSCHIVDVKIEDVSDDSKAKRVYVEFVSEVETVKAFKKWKRNNLDVRFIGSKLRLKQYESSSKSTEAPACKESSNKNDLTVPPPPTYRAQTERSMITSIERDARQLYLNNLNSDVTKEDIFLLSEDLLDVAIIEDESNRYAFLEFGSEELAEKNYAQLKETLGSALSFRKNELFKRTVKLLDLKEDETEESLMSLSKDIIGVEIFTRGNERIGFLDCGTKFAALRTYLELAESRNIVFRSQRHWNSMVLAEVDNPNPTLANFQRLAQGVKSFDILDGEAAGSKRLTLIEFRSEEDLDRFMVSSLAERISARRLPTEKETGTATDRFKLYVGDFRSKEDLELDVGNRSASVTVKEDQRGRMYAFVGYGSKEAAEEGMEHLNNLGYLVELADAPVKYQHSKCLHLLFNDVEVTKDDVMKLSKDIRRIVKFKPRPSRRRVEVLVEFKSEEVAEENLKALYANIDEAQVLVNYCGEKGKQWIRDLDERTVTIRFPNLNVTKEDIQELSPDILKIRLQRQANARLERKKLLGIYLINFKTKYSHAMCVFASRDLAEQHLNEFEALGLDAWLINEKPMQLKKTTKNLIYDPESTGKAVVNVESTGKAVVDAKSTGNARVDSESTGNALVDAELTS